MAFDAKLAERIRTALGPRRGLAEKQMFGGLAFLLHGNMCCGVHKTDLIARIAPETAGEALKAPGARPFDLTGRPMRGWLLVAPTGLRSEPALAKWIAQCVAYVATLPKK